MMLLAILLASCQTPLSATDSESDSGAIGGDSGTPDSSGPGVEYTGGTGPFAVQKETGSVAGQDVVWYTPEGSPEFALAWSHGFARGPEQHASVAALAASWGFLVVTPRLPSLSDHQANADFLATDLRDAALERGAAHFGYVGHSAGGLASLLAAADSEAWVLVGLDGVDASGLGVDAAGSVEAPALLLAGEPSTCNSSGNGRDWVPGGSVRELVVNGASHCDFESDTDGTCEAFCGAADPARQTAVQTWTMAWLVAQAGGDAGDWVAGGAQEQAAVADDTISVGW